MKIGCYNTQINEDDFIVYMLCYSHDGLLPDKIGSAWMEREVL